MLFDRAVMLPTLLTCLLAQEHYTRFSIELQLPCIQLPARLNCPDVMQGRSMNATVSRAVITNSPRCHKVEERDSACGVCP